MRKFIIILGCLAIGASGTVAAKQKVPEKCSRSKARPANPYGSVLVPPVEPVEIEADPAPEPAPTANAAECNDNQPKGEN